MASGARSIRKLASGEVKLRLVQEESQSPPRPRGRVRNYDFIRDLERTSVDYCAAVRSLYRQNRRDAITNGAEADLAPFPDMPDEEDDLEDEGKKPDDRPAQ